MLSVALSNWVSIFLNDVSKFDVLTELFELLVTSLELLFSTDVCSFELTSGVWASFCSGLDSILTSLLASLESLSVLDCSSLWVESAEIFDSYLVVSSVLGCSDLASLVASLLEFRVLWLSSVDAFFVVFH